MILDKENYESRGPLKGFFYFIWTMLTAHRPEKDKGLEQQIRGIPLLVLDQDDKLVCRSCRECEAVPQVQYGSKVKKMRAPRFLNLTL